MPFEETLYFLSNVDFGVLLIGGIPDEPLKADGIFFRDGIERFFHNITEVQNVAPVFLDTLRTRIDCTVFQKGFKEFLVPFG